MNRLFEAIAQSLDSAGLTVSDKSKSSDGTKHHGAVRLTRQVTDDSDWVTTTEIARFHLDESDNTIGLVIHRRPMMVYTASDPDSIEKLVKTVKEEYDRVLAEHPLAAAYRDSVGISMKGQTVEYTLSGAYFGA